LLIPLLTVLTLALPGDGLPVQAPKSVGMSAERLRTIDRVVKRGITAGGFPGASVVVGRKGAAVWQKGFGSLSWSKESPAVVAERTIYDVASLTKVVGTTTALMVLFDENRVALDSAVRVYLPAFSGGFRDSVTVRQLLMHRGGLPAGRDLWRIARTPQEARRAVIETELVCKPGSCYIYSDLGADLLGMIVEEVSGQRLDVFLEERVFGPLGMTDTFFRPADSVRSRIAPTEVTPPRGYPIRGEVHDENAYALGGVAGHAGLFSTAADLSIFAQMMLNGGHYNGVRILSDSTVSLFIRRAAGTRALGWDTAEDNAGGSGQFMSGRSYGHTGYTGTSMWIDPDRDMFVVLLTNRVHAPKARRPAKIISDVRADLADAAALAVVDGPGDLLAMPAAFRSDRAVGWNRPSVSPRKSRKGRAASRSRARSSSAKARSAKSTKGSAAGKTGASKAKPKATPKKSTKAASSRSAGRP
jgi:CubicO group peptidase (beta-lactamase class C family)